MIRLEAQQTIFVPTRKMSPRMDFESSYNALSPLNIEFLYVYMSVTYTTSNKKETYQNEWYSKNISFSAHMNKIFFVEKWTMRNKKCWAITIQDIPIEFIDLDILGVFVGCQFMF